MSENGRRGRGKERRMVEEGDGVRMEGEGERRMVEEGERVRLEGEGEGKRGE